MKQLLLFFFIALSLSLSAQSLRFSSDITESKNSDIQSLATTWENYVKACAVDYKSGKDSLALPYWHSNHAITNDDIVKEVGFKFPTYLFGEVFTYSIKEHDDWFEIASINTVKSNDSESVFMIYKVGAKKENGAFKFFNYFDIRSKSLSTYNTNYINYYYPCTYSFNKKEANKANSFVQKLIKEYNLPVGKVNYVLGESIDECNAFIGFDYTIMSSTLKYAGLYLPSGIILSTRPNHFHELVHSVFIKNYPNAHQLFHEGIATYYGGSAQLSLSELKTKLKDFLAQHPETDLTDFNSYSVLIDNTLNPFYVVGAIVIEQALKSGPDTVQKLFGYNRKEDIFTILNNVLDVKKEDFASLILNSL